MRAFTRPAGLAVALFLLALSLRVEPAVAAKSSPKACSAPEYHQLDFWIGDWNVYRRNGTLIGRTTVTKDEGGCVVVGRWQGVDHVQGTSLNEFDAQMHRWHETWMDSTGGLLVIDGKRVGDSMLLAGSAPGSGLHGTLNRMEWTPLAQGGIRQHWTFSEDGGRTWHDAFDGYERRKSTATSVKSLLSGRLVEVTYGPGGSSASHSHSCGVVVYVLRGALNERLGSGLPFTIHEGEAAYESPHQEHVVSANASSTQSASFLAAFTCDPHSSHRKGTQ